MEKVLGKAVDVKGNVFRILFVGALALSLMSVFYGFDSVAPGVHDAFHDFRHSVGMPCH